MEASKPQRMAEQTEVINESYLAPNPNFKIEYNRFKKNRNPMTHLTPKKKKRK